MKHAVMKFLSLFSPCCALLSLPLEGTISRGASYGTAFTQPCSYYYSSSPCPSLHPFECVEVGGGCSSYTTSIHQRSFASRRHPSSYDRYKMHDHAQQFPSAYYRPRPMCAPPVPVDDNYCEPYEYIEYTETFIVEEPAVGACLPTIRAIYDNGELIQLDDGSLWQIPPFDKGNMRTWTLNDTVQISSTEDKQFPWRLTNRCSHSTVRATMKADAASQSNLGCSCHDTNSQGTLLQNIDSGDLLELRDGTLWEIAAYEQMKSKLWRVGDKIFITRSENPIYPFLLTNLSSQEKVQASLKTSI